jgi:hypothetical protein
LELSEIGKLYIQTEIKLAFKHSQSLFRGFRTLHCFEINYILTDLNFKRLSSARPLAGDILNQFTFNYPACPIMIKGLLFRKAYIFSREATP